MSRAFLYTHSDTDSTQTGVTCLSDRDVSVRQRAVKLLGVSAKGKDDVVDELMNIALDSDGNLGWQSTPEGRQFAVKALSIVAEVGDEEVCDALVSIIDDDERLVRQATADALKKVTAKDDIDTISMLMEIRDKPDREWRQKGELVKEIRASVTGVLQVHIPPPCRNPELVQSARPFCIKGFALCN